MHGAFFWLNYFFMESWVALKIRRKKIFFDQWNCFFNAFLIRKLNAKVLRYEKLRREKRQLNNEPKVSFVSRPLKNMFMLAKEKKEAIRFYLALNDGTKIEKQGRLLLLWTDPPLHSFVFIQCFPLHFKAR